MKLITTIRSSRVMPSDTTALDLRLPYILVLRTVFKVNKNTLKMSKSE